MLRHRLWILGALSFFGCHSERAFEMTSEMTGQTCAAQGQALAEPEVRLRYVNAPKYYELFCSSALATALKASAKPTVRMVARRNNGQGSYSICEVAGIKANAPGTECTFEGHKLGGYDTVPGRDSNQSNKPAPWD